MAKRKRKSGKRFSAKQKAAHARMRKAAKTCKHNPKGGRRACMKRELKK